MKNFRKLFALLLTLSLIVANLFVVFAFTASAEGATGGEDSTENNDTTTPDTDADGTGDTTTDCTDCEDTNNDGKCDSCGEDMPTADDTHTHVFADATCTEPKKCECGATDGEPLGHTFAAPTCTEPKKCECGETLGEPLGHIDVDKNGACDTCSVCISHTDADENNKCDNCESCISHVDANSDKKCDSCGAEYSPKWSKRVLTALKMMGIGMLGIFLVTGIIILSVYLLNKLTSIEKKKISKE